MKQYISLIAAAVLLSSCEKTISVKTPPHESRLVINSANIADDVFVVGVGKSVGVTEYSSKKSQDITNAAVVLSEDGKVIESLQYDAFSQKYISKTIAKEGKSYTLKVSSTGFPDAEASASVPGKVTISNIKVVQNARNSSGIGTQDEVTITFTDPASSGDYYFIRMNPAYSLSDSTEYYYYYDPCVSTTDPSVENSYGDPIDVNTCYGLSSLFVRDELFNGSKKELKLYVTSGLLGGFVVTNDGDTLYPSIELMHVTEAQYKYQKTVRYVTDNEGNPFAEPTSVYSNVKNGYGIFSIMNTDMKEIKQ